MDPIHLFHGLAMPFLALTRTGDCSQVKRRASLVVSMAEHETFHHETVPHEPFSAGTTRRGTTKAVPSRSGASRLAARSGLTGPLTPLGERLRQLRAAAGLTQSDL